MSGAEPVFKLPTLRLVTSHLNLLSFMQHMLQPQTIAELPHVPCGIRWTSPKDLKT